MDRFDRTAVVVWVVLATVTAYVVYAALRAVDLSNLNVLQP